MLFNSYIFIFALLPIAVFGFYAMGTWKNGNVSLLWLIFCSLFFYAWWNPAYLFLITASILFNYCTSIAMGNQVGGAKAAKPMLLFGIFGNLAVLFYFKYANFFVESVNAVTGSSWILEKITLPLAISFFTFQQITYLVDTYRGRQKDQNFLHYCLFVSFFPQLIAGPIVHHSEMLPQFSKRSVYQIDSGRIAVGATIFFIGLFKKTVLADGCGLYADRIFSAAEQGYIVTFFEAWVGILSYTFQIYFDFSGYSDMAVGLGRLFGIRLPINFYSPYRSRNIIDFWRRWHMTLSRFLKDYLYIPLGGNRVGASRQRINLMLTMLLGGLWHGAGWTFIIWGGLHGIYLLINHLWRGRTKLRGISTPNRLAGCMNWLLTFLAVSIAWVFFRAESLGSAGQVLAGATGFNGIVLPDTYIRYFGPLAQISSDIGIKFASALTIPYFEGVTQIADLLVLLLICLLLPNTAEFISDSGIDAVATSETNLKTPRLSWHPTIAWAIAIGVLGLIAVLHISPDNKFLYFNF